MKNFSKQFIKLIKMNFFSLVHRKEKLFFQQEKKETKKKHKKEKKEKRKRLI